MVAEACGTGTEEEVKESPALAAAKAHTDLNVFHAVIILMESGLVYTQRGKRTADKVIDLCKAEAARQLAAYDRAMELAAPARRKK